MSMNVLLPMEDVSATALILMAATIVHVLILLDILLMKMVTAVLVHNSAGYSLINCMYVRHSSSVCLVIYSYQFLSLRVMKVG